MKRPKVRRPSRTEAGDGLSRLWAPWRVQYVRKIGAPGKKGCIFCFGDLGAAARRQRLVLYADPVALVMLNRYPYNNGHLMVAPRRHVASPEMLTPEERAMLGEVVTASLDMMRRAFNPAGFNLGANLGRVAGAGIADHMHWHAVPRWDGDTNFMTVLASSRVLSEDLDASFARLSPLFKALKAPVS